MKGSDTLEYHTWSRVHKSITLGLQFIKVSRLNLKKCILKRTVEFEVSCRISSQKIFQLTVRIQKKNGSENLRWRIQGLLTFLN